MSGRRGRATGRGRNKRFNCYQRVSNNVDERPAFDNTPLTEGSAWDTMPTESIFRSPSPPRRRERSPSPDRFSPGWRTSSPVSFNRPGRSANPGMPYTRTGPQSRPPTQSSSSWQRAGPSSHAQSYAQSVDSSCSTLDDDDDSNFFYNLLSSNSPPRAPIHVDTSPLPPWKPYYACERLEDPNNPPPMFHPMFSNEWRYDPNISEDLRSFYRSSITESSPHYGIFDYGKLTEFNPHNVYNTEQFDLDDRRGVASTSSSCSAPRKDDAEVFGDPEEALARPTDDVPDKFRKEKWRYFEVKKRLELFKKLGMETDLAMYEGQLERMEADPWTRTDEEPDFEVYVPGSEADPAYDDELLERMEELVNPNNEGLKEFYAAMANPPPIKDECSDDLERLEQLVAPTNEGRRRFMAAMENPRPSRPLAPEDCAHLEQLLQEEPLTSVRREDISNYSSTSCGNKPFNPSSSTDIGLGETETPETETADISNDSFSSCLDDFPHSNDEQGASNCDEKEALNTTFTISKSDSEDSVNGC